MTADTTAPRTQALNPETPLEELLILAEEYPDEVLRNPVFDLLLVEDPGFLSRMSGDAQLAILKSDACPEFVRSLFRIGDVTVYAAENYQDESHFYDYDFDGRTVRLKGTSEGCEWQSLILQPPLLPYFIGTLDDEVENGYGESPGTSAFLSAAVHHTTLVDIGESGKDKRYFSPPDDADEAIVWLDDEEYSIYRDEDDYRWRKGPKTETLKEIAEAFFPAYDDGEMDYQDEYDDRCRRGWEFERVEGFELHCRAGAGSQQYVDASVDDLTDLLNCLGSSQPDGIGVLIQVNLGGCGQYGLLEDIELPEGLDEVGDLTELRTLLEEHPDWAEQVVETFTDLGGRLLENSSILGVTQPTRVEVLLRQSTEDDPSLLGTVATWGGESFAYGDGNDTRYRVEGGQWIALTTFLDQIQDTCELQERLLFTVAAASDLELNLRLHAEVPYIKGSMGCEFSEEIDLDIELTQCLPVTAEEYLCIHQGYDHGEFETGIMNCGFCGGGYTYTHRSLEGTVWEGMGLAPATA
jgi:hypothetical protein